MQMSDTWLTRSLCVALLAAVAMSIFNCSSGRSKPLDAYGLGRGLDLAHAAMNAGMASMLTPWYGPMMRLGVSSLFAAIAAIFCVLLIHETRARQLARLPHTLRLASFGYHALAAGVMLYSLDAMHPPLKGMQMSGMHRDMTQLDWCIFSMFMGDAVLVVLAAILLPKVLAMAAATLLRADGQTLPVSNATVALDVVPHVIMDVGMMLMLTVS